MRELKFRVWSEEDREYRTDCDVFRLFHGKTGCPATIYNDEGDRFDIEQYTGLKDKNGKEIYEGDIVRFDAISYEIYWSDDFSGWHNRRTDGGERIYGADGFEEVTRFGSVIGNIHENAELLEEEE